MKKPVTYHCLRRLAGMKDEVSRFTDALNNYGITYEGYECVLSSNPVWSINSWNDKEKREVSNEEKRDIWRKLAKDFEKCRNIAKLEETFFFKQCGENTPIHACVYNYATQRATYCKVEKETVEVRKLVKV